MDKEALIDALVDRIAEACTREHCLCQRTYVPYLTRVEHENAAAEHLTPVEVVNRRLETLSELHAILWRPNPVLT